MLQLGQAAQEVADAITALGVPAVVDARDLNPPGAWVTIAPVGYDFLSKGAVSVAFDVFLVARDLPSVQALDSLSDMLAPLADALHLGDVTPMTVTLVNHSADPLPSLSFRIDTRIEDIS